MQVEWTNYAVQLSQQLGLGVRGRPKGYVGEHLDVADLDKFADDQIVQLYELMKATTEQSKDDADAATDSKSTKATSSDSSSTKNS